MSSADQNVLILDGIRDPGNVGTILRTAAAFGCDTVILSSDCAEVYNPKTVRAGMGAVFRQKTVTVTDLAGTVRGLINDGKKVYCATLDETSVNLLALPQKENRCFVIGNEGNGIRTEIIKASSGSVIIPMQPGAESLNAAAAATVLLWEQYKDKAASV